MEIALRFNNVSKCFGRQPILKKFDLSVYRGECVGLVGVNGAGKTTLLKCLLDLCDIDGGSIEIFEVNHLKPEARARLAFLPEQFVAPYFATGDDFLRYMSKLYGIEYAPASVQQTLVSLDLDRAMLSKPVRQLSKGMAQKLGLAATLLSRKDLFVLDEPMNGLDPKTRTRFKHYLLDLKGQGHTLFFSTHLLVDVEALCDHIAILHDSELRFVGSPRDYSAQFGNGESLEQAYLKLVTRDNELKDLA